MTERDSHYPPAWRYRLRLALGRHADAIVANSAAGLALWADRAPGARLFAIDNIAPPPPPPSDGREDLVVFVGRLEAQKNVLVTVRAFARLAARRPHLRFALAGEGSLRPRIETILAGTGLTGRIALLGFSPDGARLLSRAGALVALSHHEGLPNAVLEAVASGTPVLASDIAAHRELLGPAYPYLVADRHDPAAVAHRLAALLDDPDAARHLAFARQRLAAMTPEAVAGRYLALFRSVMEARP